MADTAAPAEEPLITGTQNAAPDAIDHEMAEESEALHEDVSSSSPVPMEDVEQQYPDRSSDEKLSPSPSLLECNTDEDENEALVSLKITRFAHLDPNVWRVHAA